MFTDPHLMCTERYTLSVLFPRARSPESSCSNARNDTSMHPGRADHPAWVKRMAAAGAGGRKRAAVATAHRLLELAYHLLTRREDDSAPGSDYYLARDRQTLKRRPHP
jgi:hypothetical protein